MNIDHSVIFIGQPRYERFDQGKNNSFNFWDLPKRVYSSFIPPLFGDGSRKIYVDWFGPLIAISLLSFLLHFGHVNKHPSAAIATPPLLTLVLYASTVPPLCYFIAKLGRSDLDLSQVTSLLGYGLYGHLATLLVCLTVDQESSNTLFFLCLSFFGGLTSLRIALVFLLTIPKPAARLVVCSLVSILHLLFLVFVHFAYMHRTFIYGPH